MSITAAMYTGVSGLLGNAEGINVIGNNISNVNTIGFKSSRMLFSDMIYGSAANNSQIGKGTQIQKVDNLFSPGAYSATTNTTDLAIQGDGFFVLANPAAVAGTAVPCDSAYYTKAGAFKLDSSSPNPFLVNSDGYKVLDTAGMPIALPATASVAGAAFVLQKIVGIDANGVISAQYANAAGTTTTEYYGGNGVTVAADPTGATYVRIAEAKIPNPQGMIRQGGTLFTLNSATSGLPIDTATGARIASGAPVTTYANGTTEKLLSNNLELSNVDMAGEFVNLITTQRAYSANSKTIMTADEMTQEVLNLKR